jgi:hypothetical protein
MIIIENTLVSEEIFEKKFLCELSSCRGACCVKGDSGAPLEFDELEKIEEVFDKILPYMNEKGKKAVEEQGLYLKDTDGEMVTPLVEGKECAYVFFDHHGTAKCAFEQAYRNGEIDFPKPVSCHLYPIRVSKLKEYDALNYDRWDICKPAIACGKKANLKIFQFLKEPLIRKYGQEWYNQAIEVDKLLQEESKS